MCLHYIAYSASLLGLALTYAVSLHGMFQYCVRQSAEVENIVSITNSNTFMTKLLFQRWYQLKE